MPITSPEEPVRTLRELGLPGRAVTALTRAGITDPAALAALTRRELSSIPGLGTGLVAAIRTVVPEPPGTLAAPRPGAGPAEDARPDDDESPATPAIPSFESLRGPRRRSAVDLLLPDAPPAPRSAAPPSPAAAPPSPAAADRPPDYADLLRLGVHVARALAVAPVAVTRWSVSCLRRLLGG